MKHLPIAAALTSVVTALLLSGCGGTSDSLVDQRRSANDAYLEANRAYQGKEYEAAKAGFLKATQSGKLYPDLLEDAIVKLAVCSAATGDFEGANSELAKLEKYCDDPARALAAKSYVLAKQGKQRESKRAWAQARRINRYVQKFED